MLSIPKYVEQYAQNFRAIFYFLCCAFQHHVMVSREDLCTAHLDPPPRIVYSDLVGYQASHIRLLWTIITRP